VEAIMKRYSILAYDDAGCPWLKDCAKINKEHVFYAILQATDGRVCDTGCAQFDDGKCPGYQNLTKGEK
jgi:hypothetical protein